MTTQTVSPRFIRALKNLLWMIITLMALGAFVRTMKAGLACPDWPLCFGKIIPDWHFGVWLEFLHRADAGLVALVFFGCFIYAMKSPAVPKVTKRAAVIGLILLLTQILMGGLTVLWLVKKYVVTAHLMLATGFFVSVLWMLWTAQPELVNSSARVPVGVRVAVWTLNTMVLGQIFLGGLVASTYSGSVCVDWPLCNGEWVPTWSGAIGLQIVHRFTAYALALGVIGLAVFIEAAHRKSRHSQLAAPWMNSHLLKVSRLSAAIVVLQVVVGVANLMLFIPAWLTVLHQSLAVLLFAVMLRLMFISRSSVAVSENSVRQDYPAAHQAQLV
ncbi:MAG: hypothetical protein RL563_479 [Pseudomonadota bacterium]